MPALIRNRTLLAATHATLFFLDDNGEVAVESTFKSAFLFVLPNAFAKTRVTQISCSDCHVLICTNERLLFAAGSNSFGQLGDAVLRSSSVLIRVNAVVDVVSSAAGDNHSVCVTVAGDAFAFGCNSDGQCAVGEASQVVAVPSRVPLSNVVGVTCGPNFTVFLSRSNELRACGYNANGELGVGDLSTRATPAAMVYDREPSAAPMKIACGRQCVVVLDTDGKARACGRVRYAGVSVDSLSTCLTPVDWLEARCDLVACGAKFTVFASTVTDRVYFGGEESGNVGCSVQDVHERVTSLVAHHRNAYAVVE
jgi:alpha-tubulin suppressor-like RCC1 family protein